MGRRGHGEAELPIPLHRQAHVVNEVADVVQAVDVIAHGGLPPLCSDVLLD
ncbi:hypothetical protein [Nonomuraea sp. K271]|uniref:hypothetical protein n=1 Tax=Nonomuraea sp. K271 TaxID=1848319 RepID=UPI001F18DD84|nr:hypothetical protein [Nonomuraea sp. K271]